MARSRKSVTQRGNKMKSLKNYRWGDPEVGLALGRPTSPFQHWKSCFGNLPLSPSPGLAWWPELYGEQESEKPGAHPVPLPGAADLGCGSPGEGGGHLQSVGQAGSPRIRKRAAPSCCPQFPIGHLKESLCGPNVVRGTRTWRQELGDKLPIDTVDS